MEKQKSPTSENATIRVKEIMEQVITSPEALSIEGKYDEFFNAAWLQFMTALGHLVELQRQEEKEVASLINERLAEAGFDVQASDATGPFSIPDLEGIYYPKK